ncbi:hypothetical protein BREU_2287 [Bifidobacterium reuteri DSM 23975]|uniref:Uncharacterized protein n=1 Tax=Bifidobacterium reuteri DSM 23975 TaxID=1437610 RepID=A0A087CNQ1_9BIFI|nr:hypothetical protein BREU_2287 [Bifidobacterium reuteri DSM 23975]
MPTCLAPHSTIGLCSVASAHADNLVYISRLNSAMPPSLSHRTVHHKSLSCRSIIPQYTLFLGLQFAYSTFFLGLRLSKITFFLGLIMQNTALFPGLVP